jgi:hypothetical protein
LGEYTDNQKFYLIDPTELVSVESDINYNLHRADSRVRSLIEYTTVDPSVSNISVSTTIDKDTGYKFYKAYSNSVWSYDGRSTQVLQDFNSIVDPWSVEGITFEPGYGSPSAFPQDRIAYSVRDNFVRLRGRLVLNDTSNDLPLASVENCFTLPTNILPLTQKYFFCNGGNAASNQFQTFRVFIPPNDASDKRIEFIKYGGNASGSGDRYLSLGDIYYPIGDI